MSDAESKHVCPWWIGYLLISPLRRWGQNPRKILSPYVCQGMTVLEPGPGMGFFTIELARLVGPKGKVIAIDVQRKMLDALAKRARRAALQDRIELRTASGSDMGTDDLRGRVDFALAFALVHELPDAGRFFEEVHAALRPGGQMLLAEPSGHVRPHDWDATVRAAEGAGFKPAKTLPVWRSHSVLLTKASAG